MTPSDSSSHELPLARAELRPGASNREDDLEIHRVVDRFYVMVRDDELLGPIFDRWVKDWTVHLRIMENFWSSAIHRTGRYSGRPLEIHRKIPDLSREQFHRWLTLWTTAVEETVRPEWRPAMITMAQRMADSMAMRLLGPAA